MTPTIADRLDSMIQAMTDIMLPAVDPGEILAREQAGLVIAHLRMIQTQLPLADRFETVELDAAIALGRDLLPLAKGGALTVAVRDRLAVLLDGARAATAEERHRSLCDINAAMALPTQWEPLPRACSPRPARPAGPIASGSTAAASTPMKRYCRRAPRS